VTGGPLRPGDRVVFDVARRLDVVNYLSGARGAVLAAFGPEDDGDPYVRWAVVVLDDPGLRSGRPDGGWLMNQDTLTRQYDPRDPT
jgi:hypothetical protein